MNKIIQLNEERIEVKDFPRTDKVTVKVLLVKLAEAGHGIDLKEVKLFQEDHGKEIHLKLSDEFWNSPNLWLITKPKHKKFNIILDDNKVAIVKDDFVLDREYIFGISGLDVEKFDIYMITDSNDIIVDEKFKVIVKESLEFFSVQRVVQNG